MKTMEIWLELYQDLREQNCTFIKSRWSFARGRLQCDFVDGCRVTLVELDNDWEYASQIIQTHVNGHQQSSLPFVFQKRSVCGVVSRTREKSDW